jgi:hypothetical protein
MVCCDGGSAGCKDRCLWLWQYTDSDVMALAVHRLCCELFEDGLG